jgi:nucleotide-binding universal stress UspA family protein
MTIIAAVDLSKASTDAARTAARIARRLRARLVLVRVVEPMATTYPEIAFGSAGVMEASLREAAEKSLAELRAGLAGEEVEVETLVFTGSPAHAITDYAREQNARLVVMGTHGRSPAARLLVGSVAQKTMLEAPCPVLALREGAAPFDEWLAGKRPLRVVVGVDRGGPATEAALEWVRTLGELGPCQVTLVHEYWPPAEYARLGLRGPRELGETDPEVVAILERELRAGLPGIPGLKDAALIIKAQWGRAADGLALDAHAAQADLLVVGTHQPHGLERLKVGSSALMTLHASRVPVLCVPARSRPPAAAPATVPVIRSVLVATDFSALGNAAVPHAYSLLRGRGGVVELCHVCERTLPSPAYVFDVRDQGLPAAKQHELERQLEALIPAGAADLDVTSHTTVIDGGSAAEQILQAARRLGVDAIVIASHGRSGVSRSLFGSVAEAVVRGSERPVYVVRGPAVAR